MHMNQSIEQVVKDAISRQKRCDVEGITLDSVLSDLGVTSLDAITIVYDIEEAFDVEVPNDQLDSLETVRDIVEGIESLIAVKA
jgi:acyl carrier protein